MNTAEVQLSEAEASLSRRELPAALGQFNNAEAFGAERNRCSAGRWMIYMLQGDFEAAWQESDAITARGKSDAYRLWHGEALQGRRVMLRCLHGFGDAVQFLRYGPQLRAIASELIVEVNPRFVDLARCFAGVDQVITWGDAAPAEPPEWDVQVEIMELPYLFRTNLSDLPVAERYLSLPMQPTIPQNSSPFRVGLVWTAGEWNPERSIPFSTLQPLLEVDDCEFWSLEPSNNEQHGTHLLHRDEISGSSIIGLAQKIRSLDLVVTVDTLAAHLAGVLNIPCWVLLQHAADWRWMHAREDSPWYPSLRLLRQPVAGDWASVIASARQALQQQIAASARHAVCAS